MTFHHKIKSLSIVGDFLKQFLEKLPKDYSVQENEFANLLQLAEQENTWFTQDNLQFVLQYWSENLNEKSLTEWIEKYNIIEKKQKIGLILAGNIPMVGFHDVLCVLLLGNKAIIKLSSKDSKLIPFLLNYWQDIDDSLDFTLVEKLEHYDKVIATGSNNSANYFEYYFRDIPHLIRKNRTSVAVLSGYESDADLQFLAQDMLQYFGLGCRNVTQLFVPKDYDLNKIFYSMMPYKGYINHHKYANNYDYHRAIFLLNKDLFWDNNLVMLKESNELFSPISVVFYQEYSEVEDVNKFLVKKQDSIQCVVSHLPLSIEAISFGKAQKPTLGTFADGIDTISWLLM